MKIIVTGSLGNISKPLIQMLVSQGHLVTVISSNAKNQQGIEMLGATAAIGSIADVNFLTRTFQHADAVYAMIPLNYSVPDLSEYMQQMASNYRRALQTIGMKRIVVLSGWAADILSGENIESVFDGSGGAITFMRPASFYTNFYQSTQMIRGAGLMGKLLALRYLGLGAVLAGKTGLLLGNFGGNDRTIFVSPVDIAAAVAEELLLQPDKTNADNSGKPTIRYVGSEEMTCNEAARIIGTAIGKPWLKWVLVSNKQMLRMLKLAKMPRKLAETLVEMQSAIHSGKTLENFHRNRPRMGQVKLTDFAKEFAVVYNKK